MTKEKLAENDLFVTAMVEYSVGESSASNGWTSLVQCVLSEFAIPSFNETKMFLRTQELLFKQNGGVLPAAYRSAKSTLMAAINYGVPIVASTPKSEMYLKTKAAKDALADKPDSYEVFSKKLAAVKGAFLNLDEADEGRACDEVRATFGI